MWRMLTIEGFGQSGMRKKYIFPYSIEEWVQSPNKKATRVSTIGGKWEGFIPL
jgi:hypothetical protein